MLPISHLASRTEPFDRYCTGNCELEESYRAVVNEGVRAYQFLIYLILVEEYFGPEIRRQVHEHQINVLGEISDTCGSIEHAFELIVTALATKEIRISTEHGDVDVPLEMNIALLLLLTSPRS